MANQQGGGRGSRGRGRGRGRGGQQGQQAGQQAGGGFQQQPSHPQGGGMPGGWQQQPMQEATVGGQGRGRGRGSIQAQTAPPPSAWGVSQPLTPAAEAPPAPIITSTDAEASYPSVEAATSQQPQSAPQAGRGKGKKKGAAAVPPPTGDAPTAPISTAADVGADYPSLESGAAPPVERPQDEPVAATGRGKGKKKKRPAAQAAPGATGQVSQPASQRKITMDMGRLSVKDELPQRPDTGGKAGQLIQVGVNCWDMKLDDKQVLMYDVEPLSVYRMSEGKKVDIRMQPKDLRKMVGELTKKMPDDVVYDGGRIVYKLRPFPGISEMDTKKEEEVNDPDGRDSLFLRYNIKKVAEFSTGALESYVRNSRASTLTMPQDTIRFIDCLFRTATRDEFEPVGRSAVFYRRAIRTVNNKLFDIHTGFISSVRPQWKVRLNVDMTCKAFFRAGNLADVLYDKYQDSMYQPRQWNFMVRDIRGIRVQATHFKTPEGKPYSRKFTIFDLSKFSAAEEMIEEQKMSVKDYYKTKYNITLKFPELPCVNVRKAGKVYLPMELLTIVPYQPPTATKADVASEVIRCAAVKPQERFRELQGFVKRFTQQTALFRYFNLTVDQNKQRINARVLPQPRGTFSSAPPTTFGRGKWRNDSFLKPSHTTSIKWAILSLPPDHSAQAMSGIVSQQLPRVASQLGLNFIPNPFMKSLHRAELQHTLMDLQQNGVVLAILILFSEDTYSFIKRYSDLELGIRTQCVKAMTLRKPNVFPNLLLKINGKLGGVNWQVNDLIKSDLVMVFGADVTHPAPTQKDEIRRSIAAVTGSISPDLMRYAVVVRSQETTAQGTKNVREIIDNMEQIADDLLRAFAKANNDRLPQKIIFYRDGVSDGQFQAVLLEELAAMQRACYNLKPDYEPRITYIVVQKRHHIRFEPLDPRAKNVEPGTVVDTDVTHKQEFDFYLCSQEGIQGTSKPAHYHVLYDDNAWTSDALQLFTYCLCHAYMRCTRSVSYPAPTYYSHLAAFRARDWLGELDKPETLLDGNRFRVHQSQFTGMFFL